MLRGEPLVRAPSRTGRVVARSTKPADAVSRTRSHDSAQGPSGRAKVTRLSLPFSSTKKLSSTTRSPRGPTVGMASPLRNTARLWAEDCCQSCSAIGTPRGVNQPMSVAPAAWMRRPSKNRRRRNTGWAWRKATSWRVKSSRSSSSASQCSQDSSLSWQ